MLGRFALPLARGVHVPSYRRFPAPAAVPCPVLAGHFPLPHAPSAASVALPPALGLPRPGALRVSRPALCDSIRGSPVASRLIHVVHPPSRYHCPFPPAARFPVPLPTSSRLVPAAACSSMTCLWPDLPHRRPPPPPHSASPAPPRFPPAARFSAPPSPHSPSSTLDPRRCGLLADSGPSLRPPLRFAFLLHSTAPFMHGRFALPLARGVRVPCYRRFPAPAAVPCPVLAGHFPLPHAPSAASVALPPALGLPRPGSLRVSRPALCDSIRGSPVASRLIHVVHPPSRYHCPFPPAVRFPVPLPTSSRLVPAAACSSMTCLWPDLPHRRPPPPPHSASPAPPRFPPAARFSAPPSPHSPSGTLDPRRCGLLADSGPSLRPPLRFAFLLNSTAPFMLGRFALPLARGVRVPSYRRFPAPVAVPCPVLAGHFPRPHAPSAASVALPPALGLPRPGALRVSRPALCDSIRGSPVASRLIHVARHPPPPPPLT